VTDIHRSALVPYSAQQMFALVADIPAYPEFLPWCSGARIVESGEEMVVADIDIAYGGVHKTFTTRNLVQPGKMMEMRLVQGPFSHLHGYWRFAALGAEGSRISLDLEFGVSNRMLGMVLTRVFTGIANELVDCFHQRAAKLYGPGRATGA
jgi:coenzyme Q-binding protein COQ10